MKALFYLFKVTTLMIVISTFATSCDTYMVKSEEITPEMKMATNYISSTDISVDWNNWNNGDNYNVAMAIADFGDINNFTQAEQARTLISLSRLRVTLLKDLNGASGGVITNSHVQESDGFELNYKVKFHADFDFAQNGGRVGWGLNIGDGADGVPAGNGGTFRLAWDTDANGNAYFKPYIYHADQAGTSGDDFDVRYPAAGNIRGSVWYNIRMVFRANTGLDTNGRAELYINDVPILKTAIRWTKNDSKRKVNQLLFANYRSGAGSESPVNANVWFDDFNLKSTIPNYTPSWCDSVTTVTNLFDPVSGTYYNLTELDASKVDLKMALADKITGETGTEFADRTNCCVAFNASMGVSNLPDGERQAVGIQIIDGDIIQERSTIRYTLGIKDNNQLVSYEVEETAEDIVNDGAKYALTAFTPLIQNHQAVSEEILNSVKNYSRNTDPRQVIAQYDNGNILIFSCGGRGFGGVGMSARDVIRILSALNVKFAFMLDGGGSVTTMVNGERITPLIDGSGTLERPRPNWLYVENKTSDFSE